MKIYILIGVLPLSFALSAQECVSDMSELECKIFQETNRVRAEHGEKKLSVSFECTEAARYHAESMEESGVYGHEIKGYKSFPERMNYFRVRGSRMAENIHHRVITHFSSEDEAAREIVSDWYDSKGHRKNMMNSKFKSIGVAVIGDYQVQCFSDYADANAAPSDSVKESESGGLKDFFGGIKIRNPFKKD